MDVRIIARHCTVTDSTREIARSRVARLSRYEPRVNVAEILLSEDGGSKHAEVRVAVPGAAHMQAHAHADTLRSALDRAVARMERQLRRRHGRRRTRRATRTTEASNAL